MVATNRRTGPVDCRIRLRIFSCAALLCLFSNDLHAATPSISAGGSHSVALQADGSVRSWGDDASGQLGVGRSLVSAIPIAVAGVTGIIAIASGYSHVIALKADGNVLAWGKNANGQLGDGTRVGRSTPVPVLGLADVVRIWAGGGRNLAQARDGSIWAWGENGAGELGDGSYEDRLSPVRLVGLTGVVSISAGGGHTLALKADGSVWAWGHNDYGQLGDGATTALFTGRATPAPVIGLSGVAEISAGGNHSLARKDDGSVWAWGAGPLGDGTTSNRLLPVQVTGLAGVAQIAAGFGHSLAITSAGNVWGWGSNGYAELGDGTYSDRLTPVPLSGLGGASAISTGFLHSVALIAGGTIAAWGNNDYGQLGDGTTQQRLMPAPVSGIAGVTAVAVGDLHTVALRADGSMLTWGDNTFGQLGNGTRIFRSTPSAAGLSGISKVSAGGAHTVVLKADGSVMAWGSNCCGQVGDGTAFVNRSTPVAVSGLNASSPVAEISAGGLHTLALRSDGSVLSWGNNYSGQLGDRATSDTTIPAQVAGLAGVAEIAAGGDHSVARTLDGTAWAWGRNDSGQLGDGSTTAGYFGRSRPERVSGLNGVRAIAAGNSHTVALKTDGTVWTWGSNFSSQLGDGTLIDRAAPVQVAGLTGVTGIAAGDAHSLALKSDGTVWAWGANYNYQLGDGTTNDRPFPVQVNGLAGIVDIAASSHSLALKNDGTVWAWGKSDSGRIGDGTLADRASPVVVLRENGAGSVAANNWFLDLDPAVAKTIPPDSIPVFLAVASSAASDITAAIQYRSQDVGTTASVYVFALAPAALVKNAVVPPLGKHLGPVAKGGPKDTTPLPCVLAQLNASGVLTAATSSSLQAYLTGVLTSQGASVSVLNGVSTALLQGAVFYVGYGSSSNSMINGGINRSVVTVPGPLTCQPQAPQTGWWWNPAESGRGFVIEVSGNNMFMAGYLYDAAGHATWMVSEGPVALDGSLFNSTLYQVANGQTLSGAYKAPAPVTFAGPVTLSFNDARTGTLIWPGGAIQIQRFDNVIGSGNGVTPAFVPENGWWWNAAESGRGFFLEFKNNYAFISGYMYEANGQPVWYVTEALMSTPQLFSSNWYQAANGQTMTGAYQKPIIINNNVGPASIQFQDATNATMTLPGGRQIPLTRFRF